MQGLMMEYQLTIPAILRRTQSLFGMREIVSRQADGSLWRYTYGECLARARRLGQALSGLGLEGGSRIATLCWNHHQHLEAYYGIPSSGFVLHTLNPRLPKDDLAYIMAHAGDRVLIVDEDLLAHISGISIATIDHIILVRERQARSPGTLDYEELIASAETPGAEWHDPHESDAATMCYTSGTTGRPKGVVYSHRAIALHSLGSALPDAFDLSENDTMLAAVPMFHANAWGLPYTAALIGARQVFARNAMDPVNLLELLSGEQVTFSAGVPTIWFGVLQELDRNNVAFDLSALRSIVVGGSACPPEMIRAFRQRHGIRIVTSWGMTEMTPVGTIGRVSPAGSGGEPETYEHRAKPGRPLPFVELRLRQEGKPVPWDGVSMGELEVRGAWVAGDYYNADGGPAFTSDGWFRTGDIASLDSAGWLEIRDRAKDLIKSGGEWISSVALENAIMGHPAVAEAAVIAVAHPRWQERPLAVVVLREGATATPEELTAHLSLRFPGWYLPEEFVLVDAIPRTGTGKFRKQLLREQYGNHYRG